MVEDNSLRLTGPGPTDPALFGFSRYCILVALGAAVLPGSAQQVAHLLGTHVCSKPGCVYTGSIHQATVAVSSPEEGAMESLSPQ